ncbi:serine/threonine-protein kinase [Chondromyces crocatus]|uniref:Protein kinase domain-containing protein n=1 Tax=Chondromyces crocatus TaxID=52 RepID=A0A0K1E9N3_CHOCO|nr:serine/threonine-protein kinase [Chondromyces crocatus]AKT37298.1 uncharacterized protein CMC5_014290 [Chondromyces crocatus]
MLAVLPEGLLFAQRYRVVRCIASGGMGAVYEVEHLETARRRALKIMHPHIIHNEELRARFQREARIAGAIESEHIVDVFDAGIDEETQIPFLVMEFLRGEDLGVRLKRSGRLQVEEALTYLQQTASTLDLTHAASIVHRDLKPANLFLTLRQDGTPRIKIIDFGVAKLLAEGASSAGTTQTVGTPLYMAPEQLLVGPDLSGAADIYALGMIAFTLLVGVAYWAPEAKQAKEPLAFALVALKGPQESAVRRAAALGVALPAAFDGWFARATAVDPGARFASASEAVHALHEVMLGSASRWGSTVPGFALATPMPSSGPSSASGSVPSFRTTPSGAVHASTAALERTANPTSATLAVPPFSPRRSASSVIAKVVALGVAVGLVVSGLWWFTRGNQGESAAGLGEGASGRAGAQGAGEAEKAQAVEGQVVTPGGATGASATAATAATAASAKGVGSAAGAASVAPGSASASVAAAKATATATATSTKGVGAKASGSGAASAGAKAGTTKKPSHADTSSLLGRD